MTLDEKLRVHIGELTLQILNLSHQNEVLTSQLNAAKMKIEALERGLVSLPGDQTAV